MVKLQGNLGGLVPSQGWESCQPLPVAQPCGASQGGELIIQHTGLDLGRNGKPGAMAKPRQKSRCVNVLMQVLLSSLQGRYVIMVSHGLLVSLPSLLETGARCMVS